MPKAVKLLGRYDVWDHKNPEVLPFQYGIRLKNTNPNESLWRALFSKVSYLLVDKIIADGKLVLQYVKQENERYCKSGALEVEIEGYRCIAINRMLASSQIFDSVWDREKYDMMVTFSIGKEKTWRLSFYTDKDDIDCSTLAKKLGGGGHKQAAGVNNLKTLPFTL
jgi:oligoribonuclease NrnB/cAMP/cGMP phosphodiesterase (DHH superfamily)